MSSQTLDPSPGAPVAEKPMSLVVPAGLLVVALGLATAGVFVLGLLRPPETRSAFLAPPGSVFYASVFVEPSVGQRRALGELAERTALDRLLPEGDVVTQVMNRFLTSVGLDHARDVAPWLGRETGISLMQGPDGALHVSTFFEMDDHALATRHLAAAPLEPRERTYEDVSYRIARGGGAADAPRRWAFGVVDDFVVVAGPPAAFEAVVDAARGASLADDGSFTAALEPLPDDRLVAGYVSDPAIAEQLALPSAAKAIAAKIAGGQESFTISVHAESDALVLAASRGDPVRLEADVLAALIQSLPIDR